MGYNDFGVVSPNRRKPPSVVLSCFPLELRLTTMTHSITAT